jgi:hypothetical protein
MIKERYIILTSFIFLLTTRSLITNAQNKVSQDSLSKYVAFVENEMDRIDKYCLLKKNILSKELPYTQRASKKTNVTLCIQGDIIRKLIYTSYDDSYLTSGKEAYYFDTIGKLISHASLMTGIRIHEIYSGSKIFVCSENRGIVSNSTITEESIINYLLTTVKYIIDYYLSSFEGIKYSTFNVSKNDNSAVLKTLTSTGLYKSPDKTAVVIKMLSKGTELHYLDRSIHRDSMNGKEKWIWLKVKDENKQEGWIWGHPTIVREY